MTQQIIDSIAKEHGISKLRAMVLIADLLTKEKGPRERPSNKSQLN